MALYYLISTDDVDEEELKKPKKWDFSFILKFSVICGIISSFFDLLTMFFLIFLGAYTQVFMTFWFLESVISEILITFSIRTKKPFYKSKPSKILLFSSIIFSLAAFFFVYSEFNILFDFSPLSIDFILIIIFILISYFSIVEIAKHFFYSKIATEKF